MSVPRTQTAAPTVIGNGGDVEVTDSGFKVGTYRPAAIRTIPCPQDASRLARVIPHAGRLFAVASFREFRS